MWLLYCSYICQIFLFFLLYYREKPKVVKPTGNSDGPDAKKAKIDPNETIVMKKVDDLSHLELYENTPIHTGEKRSDQSSNFV